MIHSFNAGRFQAGSVPEVTARAYANSQTFTAGALLVLDANGLVVECADHPTLVSCVAVQGADTGYGYQAANNPVEITGQEQKVSTYDIASKVTQFVGRMVNGAGANAPVTPTQTDVGEEFGAKQLTNGDWVIDHSETTDVCLVVTAIDTEGKYAYFRFIDSAIGL
jgi:hypothetical protein